VARAGGDHSLLVVRPNFDASQPHGGEPAGARGWQGLEIRVTAGKIGDATDPGGLVRLAHAELARVAAPAAMPGVVNPPVVRTP
jgi:hypothetical protein